MGEVNEEEVKKKMAEDLKKQQEKELAEKKKALESRIPKLEIDGLNQGDLEKKVRDLYQKVCRLEEEKYDWEVKIRKQDYEINDLTIKLNDQGKFLKPVLKKVSMTENKLAKIDKEKVRNALGFREQLKSTGQSKFTLDEKEELKKPEWGQDALKHKDEKDEEGGKEEEKQEEGQEEEEEEEEEE